jgi:hypothetical protein
MSIVRPYSLVEGYHFRGMLVTTYMTTQLYNQEDHCQHFHCHENLESQMALWLGIDVLMVASMKMAVFWAVVPCSLVVPCAQLTHRPDDGGSRHF